MRTTPAIAAALAGALLILGGCSGGDDARSSGGSSGAGSTSAGPTRSAAPSKTSEPRGTTVDITIKDGKVTPDGERVPATVGEPVTLRIHADTSGEIHVHSTPEQELEFGEGTSTRQLTIDQPGIVDVEDHALEQVIVQLEVR
jgi:hypothetical protein